MISTKLIVQLLFVGLMIVMVASFAELGRTAVQDLAGERARAKKLYDNGNYKDAYEALRKLALDLADDPLKVADDLNLGLTCLQHLGRPDEVDEFRDSVVKVHAKNWRLLQAAAESYTKSVRTGYIVAGKFTQERQQGQQPVSARHRDRVLALRLMAQAMPLAKDDSEKADVAGFWLSLADIVMSGGRSSGAWQLQSLTNLNELPDFEPGWHWGDEARGAPVDAQGNPVFHYVPKSWEESKTDGERWRFALAQVDESKSRQPFGARQRMVEFLVSQFGVETMASYGTFFSRLEEDESRQGESGAWALHTLGEDETIARLANGIKRFKLPDEFNYLRIYQELASDRASGAAEYGLWHLAESFENRRQYVKAAEYWRKSIANSNANAEAKRQRLDQIVDNWGQFEPVMTQPAGQGATVDFRFRNAKHVTFEAHEINVAKLLADVKAYIKSRPAQLDHQKLNLADLGYRIVQENQTQYVGSRVALWNLDLQPRPEHFDKRITISTPLQKAGAYLVTAKMPQGNTSQIILWLEDTAIVKKPLSGGTFYYVGDAAAGAPVPKANVEFFGFRWRQMQRNRPTLDLREFTEATDADGQIIGRSREQDDQFQWIITATTSGGRLAYLGFTGVWGGNYADAEYNQTKVFAITDRPVYRPNQKVKFKFWVRHAKYDQADKSDFANQTFNVQINNPQGEKVLAKSFTADAYGGIEGEFDLPAGAMLGAYQLFVVNYGGGSFRVEEYKKPEFEVAVDAPDEPTLLGEKIKATINAKYYFGSPVTDATVKYKVLRSSYSGQWYPRGRWDWLYGPGYWWFAYDAAWYPGWRDWGCIRPAPSWWFGFRSHEPPEVVAEREVPIGADGKLEVEIDTAIAKLIHPDEDHQYTITAEVVDQSRRTIVGEGKVLVTRKPFRVYAWTDRGFYRVGDQVRAEFQSQTLDQKPARGKGTATLYQISYQDGKPRETVAGTWQRDPDAQGHAELQLQATAAGQYRLAYSVVDEKQNTIEGAYLFTIRGQGFDGREFRFNDLELIADRREYQPGQTVNLAINTNRMGGAVLLFVRPANGIYLKPKLLRLQGKSAVEEIAVVQKDMPNFFVEAVAIAGGKLFSETKEIVVPPEKRVLEVAVVPSAETYKPGQKAEVRLKLTDSTGKPFVGSTVVAIYDKAVEYISGGSNVEDIKEAFWKWRRSHYPQNETNLMHQFWNLVPPKQTAMASLGVFGDAVADENGNEGVATAGGVGGGGFGGSGGPPRFMMKTPMAAEFAPPAPMAAAADGGAVAAPLVQPTLRTKFADTALWIGSLTTDENGTAQAALTMPQNLTTWKVRVWGMGHGTKVGQGEADVVTRKDLIVRLQAPRFFVEKDEVVLSANVHNYLKTAKLVTVSLELDGKCLTALADATRQVEIPSGDEVRVDWRVKVSEEGEAVVRMKALSDEESDAVEQRFPVYVHGMLKTESFAGALRPEDTTGKIAFRVPAERRIDQSQLEVRYSPTLAGAMVDALPYLVDYPYGCTEQTLNRFLPTIITQRILINMGLDLKKIQEKRTNLNAQEIGNDQDRSKQWKRPDRNPVFDQAEVTRMVKEGVQALTEMQLTDGGWGWFSGWGEQSFPHTTAVVVHGLQVARQNDVALAPGMLERGVAWLKNYQDRQVQLLNNALVQPKPKEPYKSQADDLDALVYMVLLDADIASHEMREFIYRDRNKLAVYSQAMFGLALHKQQQKDQLAMVLQNLRQFVVQDDENQTAYLKLPANNFWWCWYGSETEANAYYLKLLAKTDPKGPLASRLVKYLLNNRKHATYWNSTRDTALAIEGLAEYLRASGEDKPDLTVEVWLDGQKQKEVKIRPTDLFTFDNKFVLTGDALPSGAHQLELRKSGTGPLYYNAYLTNFTLEDSIAAAGLEVKVNRKIYKLNPIDKDVKVSGSRGQAVDQKVEKYDRQELPNLGALKSGDLVEVELEIDSKNDYEYVMFEDLKAAGFEPVDVRSGYNGNSLGAYMELRDNRVTFFIRALARGKHSVNYRLRAEIPGQFSALPATASAMYAPELKGNSDEIKLRISD